MYAPVTGYDSLYSATGIEQAENKLLSGTDPKLTVRNLIDLITGKQQQGASVQLTINSKAQQAAYAALKATGKSGAVVALNPKTGAILALASYPSFNPNAYATFDGTQAQQDRRQVPQATRASRCSTGPSTPRYPPGSTFKIVTSSTAFGTGRYNPNTLMYAPTSLTLPDTTNTLVNANGEVCGTAAAMSRSSSPSPSPATPPSATSARSWAAPRSSGRRTSSVSTTPAWPSR